MFARNYICSTALMLTLVSGSAMADEAYAKQKVKAMSDYMAAQKTFSFGYDTNLEFVTKDKQKITLASSGSMTVARPDNVHAKRDGGFANVEIFFNGKTLTVWGRDTNTYIQAEVPGDLDNLIDTLRVKLKRPIPGADLLASNVYEALMDGVTDTKDIGSGVIGGTECDHFAFRTKDTDWQIWIAQGDKPYPCRYMITSTQVEQAPSYNVQVRDWKTGTEVAADTFVFNNTTNARKITLDDLDIDELPTRFTKGDAK